MSSRRASFACCRAISFSTALSSLAGGRHQPDPLMPGAVLGLGQHIRRDELRVGRVVRQHQQFAGAGEQVNGHVADHQPFGGDDVGIAGAEDLLHAPDRGRAVSHRRDGLGAADTIDLRRARRARRKQERRVDAAVLAAGRADDDLRAARHLGQGHRHQRGRDQRGRAAGNVDADALERIKLLPDDRAVRIAGLPILAPGLPGKRRDVPPRLGHCRPQRFVGLERGGHQFGLGDGQLLRSQACAVEPLGQLQQSRIAARPHVIEDGPRPLLDDRVEQARGGGQLAQSLGEAGVGVADGVHGRRG